MSQAFSALFVLEWEDGYTPRDEEGVNRVYKVHVTLETIKMFDGFVCLRNFSLLTSKTSLFFFLFEMISSISARDNVSF